MAITKLVRAEFDRAVQELFDIKFIGFGEGLVTVFFYKIQRHDVKTHTNPIEKHQRSVYLLLLYT